jgi:hypothetical protein
MIPADRILIDGDTGWLIVGPLGPGADVIPGDQAIAEWRAQFDRPCETYGCDGGVLRQMGRRDGESCDCIDGRHTFDLTVSVQRPGAQAESVMHPTYRVAIMEVLPIVNVRYVGGVGIEWPDGRHANPPLPPAAAPGMFAVKLAVRA